MIFENYDSIVFAGDSVTEMGSAQPNGAGLFDSLGHGYVRIIDNMLSAWYPEKFLRVANAGIGGDTSRELLSRFRRDVVDLHPDWVSICIGINDVWRQFDTPSLLEHQVQLDEYEANIEKMILTLKGSIKGIFLMTPYYMEPNRGDWMRKRMDEYGEVCKKMSEKYGCIFIDLQQMFNTYLKCRHSTFVAGDRIHPNSIGATLIAREFLKHCDFDYDHLPKSN